MKKIFLGFEDIEITTINDVEYVKLADIEKIARYAYGNYLADRFRDAMSDIKLICDKNQGIVYVQNTNEVTVNADRNMKTIVK